LVLIVNFKLQKEKKKNVEKCRQTDVPKKKAKKITFSLINSTLFTLQEF